MRVLITGSSGLVGSEAVAFFDRMGFDVLGVDNNGRADFFGEKGCTLWNLRRLESQCPRFRHRKLDIRDRSTVNALLAEEPIDLLIHAAAQPSHDLAAARPFDDFDVNAVGTLNLLEACRQHRPEVVFIHMSTNKVYGDGPNHIPLKELETRYDYDDPQYANGIAENFPLDQCLHSLFGVSKAAADLMVQEYGRYFGMNTCVFRGGCLTGANHSGVELHGFLNYLTKAAYHELPYQIFGYKGKQVRDQIHSEDLIQAMWCYAQNPKPGAVYNMGGGRDNAASLLECVDLIEAECGRRPKLSYAQANRVGDHICYYTDLTRFKTDYPDWHITYDLKQIIADIVQAVEKLDQKPVLK